MTEKKQEIQFPCRWEFRLIAAADKASDVRSCVENIGNEENICLEITAGQASGSGKYETVRVACQVDCIELARTLAEKFSKVDGVRFLI